MNMVRTGLLLAALTGLFLAIGFVLGGRGGLMVAFLIALAMNFFAYWNSDKMVLRMHQARLVTRASAPDLHDLVAGLARNAGLPMPALYVLETDQPNAFATGRDPSHAAVAVTRGIMAALSREELAGVIAHELGHIRNRDTLTMTVAATIAGAIGFLAQFAMFFGGSSRDGERPNPIAAILIMLLAPLAATLVQMAISRTREFSADRAGAEICGHPRWLASALQRIEQAAAGRIMPTAEHNPASAHMFIINPLRMGGVDSLFRTHPRTEDRIAALLAIDGTGGAGAAATSATSPWQSSSAPAGGRSGVRHGSVPRAGGSRANSPWS